MQTSLIVLGSGQDGGTPQLGGPLRGHPPRMASSIAIVADRTTLLFDASPDIRAQYRMVAEHRGDDPDERHRRPFDAIFVTHAHMGHYAGLVHLGKESANAEHVPLVADATVLSYLGDNEPWSSLIRNDNVDPRGIGPDGVDFGPIRVRPVPVPHRAEFSRTNGFSISVGEAPWCLYLPDIDAWEEWPDAEPILAAHEVCLIDATFGSADEIPGRDLSGIPHPIVTETIERFAELTDLSTIVLTHINHTNQLNDPASDLAVAARESGFLIAEDGMTFAKSTDDA